MDANKNISIQQLEFLLSELYSPRVSNERRTDIERKLNDFGVQPDAWRVCIEYLSNTRDDYSIMYCLLILETCIKEKMCILPVSEKEIIRQTICQYLLQNHQLVPICVKNKLGKLVVDIGRQEWPHFYPDFFVHIYQLVQGADTVHLGLMLISTLFEELSCHREDLHASRKEEFERLVLEEVPTLLNTVYNHLEKVLAKHSYQVTATPPPSPTHSINICPTDSGSPTLPRGSFQGFEVDLQIKPHPLLDAETLDLCNHSLKCLVPMLSWIPLSPYVNSSFISLLFHYASFVCTATKSEVTSEQGTDPESNSNPYIQLGFEAMNCLCEIMSRNCVPTDLEKYMPYLLRSSSVMLQYFTNVDTNRVSASPSHNLIKVHERFSKFLRMFVSMHIRRLDAFFRVPLLDFLSLLYKYTFQQPTHCGFTMCLKIWSAVVIFLHSEIHLRGGIEVDEMLDKHRSGLLALIDGIFQKLQFQFNQPDLEELDDEFLGDNVKTQRFTFLEQCLEIIAKICDIMPDKVFQLLYRMYEENMDIYLHLERFVKVSEHSGQLELTVVGGNDCRRLHCSLHDLSTALQLIGQLVDHLSGDKYRERKKIGETIFQKLCNATEFSNKMRFYEMKMDAPLILKTDFSDVHAQLLATLRAFVYWLVQYKQDLSSSQSESHSRVECCVTDLVVSNVKQKIPLKVVRNALHLLQSLTFVVRPQYLFQLPSMGKLFEAVCAGQLSFLALEDQYLIYKCMTNALLLPWLSGHEPEDIWQARSYKHQILISNLCRPLVEAYCNQSFYTDMEVQSDAQLSLLWVLQTLNEVVSNVTEAPQKTKDAIYLSIRDAVPLISGLFPIYVRCPGITTAIFKFFIYLFGTMRSQSGSVVHRTMDFFLNAINRLPFMEYIISGNVTGIQVLENFLELLRCVIASPIAGNGTCIEGVVNFALNQIHPLIVEFNLYDQEISHRLFHLLHHLVVYNWQYFSRVPTAATESNLATRTQEISTRTGFFFSILEALTTTLKQPEIELFQRGLKILEDLNNKCRLYERPVFRDSMVMHFHRTLLLHLVHKGHDLCRDEIIVTVYNMAIVDFNSFYSSFIPQFIESFNLFDETEKNTLLNSLGNEVDFPTFSRNIQRFVSEFHHLCRIHKYVV